MPRLDPTSLIGKTVKSIELDTQAAMVYVKTTYTDGTVIYASPDSTFDSSGNYWDESLLPLAPIAE